MRTLVTALILAMIIAEPCLAKAGSHRGRYPAGAASLSSEAHERKLDYHLMSLASNASFSRYLTGGVFLAVSAYVAGVYIAQTRFTTGDVAYVAKGVVGTTGALFAVGGILTLLFPGESERSWARYRSIRPNSPKQLEEKILLGEAELNRLANRGATSRYLVGGLFTAVGVADLVWYLGTGPNHDLNFLAYLGGLYTTLGVVFWVSKSPAERERDDYLRSKESNGSDSEISLDVRPLGSGAWAGLKWSF